MTKDKVRHWRSRNQLPAKREISGEAVESAYIASVSSDDNWPLPVRPIEITVPEPNYPKPVRQNYISLHISDSHAPFMDERYNEVLYQICADLCPDRVVHHGDLVDCYQISRYQKDPRHRVSLQEEIRQAAEHLGKLAAVSPFADRILLSGNHEDRLRRLIWEMANDLPAKQVLELPQIWDNLSWEKLLGLDSMGWEWSDSKIKMFDRLIAKHGSVVRKHSAYTAKGEYEKYGKSGASGHTHRAGSYYHTDHNGPHVWFELGCGCNLNPDYCEDPDWQQCITVATWSADRSRYGVEQIIVHEGTAIFRGNEYRA